MYICLVPLGILLWQSKCVVERNFGTTSNVDRWIFVHMNCKRLFSLFLVFILISACTFICCNECCLRETLAKRIDDLSRSRRVEWIGARNYRRTNKVSVLMRMCEFVCSSCTTTIRIYVRLKGAPGSLYEGEEFRLRFVFPSDYPINSPEVHIPIQLR